jgi:hypothetical protein
MDSLDTVEIVMAFEEAFEVGLPDAVEKRFSGPDEFVDWLEISLSNQRPNNQAARLLRKLAKDQQRPELADALDGPWRREQIVAIIGEIFR